MKYQDCMTQNTPQFVIGCLAAQFLPRTPGPYVRSNITKTYQLPELYSGGPRFESWSGHRCLD
jgi:hypothetical protein